MSARRLIFKALTCSCIAAGGLSALCSAPALAQREHVFSSSFGSAGAGAGQFSRPGALAVSEVGGAAGDVYVLDRGHGRVEQFTATGTYLSQFDGSAAPSGAFSWPAGTREPAIAVDNSTNPLDPSAGDVYVSDPGHHVIDKFSAEGSYIGQLTGGLEPFREVWALAVDASGGLWVDAEYLSFGQARRDFIQFNDALTNEYISGLEVKTQNEGSYRSVFGGVGFSIDSSGDIYIGLATSTNDGENPVAGIGEFSSAGTLLTEAVDGEYAYGVAVDRSSDDVYIDHGTTVAAYGPSGSFIERFGSPQMQASQGIAVNAASGTVYTSDVSSGSVEMFTAFTVPDVRTGSASDLRETAATVNGTVNPDGLTVASCVFEYGTSSSYGQEAECSPKPGSGSASLAVSATLSGLQSQTTYHFRLKVANANGTSYGEDGTFFTPLPVAISEEGVADVSAEGAQFSAQVNPGGSDTKFRFEYGTTPAYGQAVPAPEGDLGPGTAREPASVSVQGLQPDTTYHVRLAATNVLGTVYGADESFSTQSSGSVFSLPDSRVWTMVSPPNKNGGALYLNSPGGSGQVIEAAEDGAAITYVANGPVVANPAGNSSPSEPTQIISRRTSNGWSVEDIATPHAAAAQNPFPEYVFFAPDLSQALVQPVGDTPLSPEVKERTPYVRDNTTGTYTPLVTASNVPAGTFFGGEEEFPGVHTELATPDFSHVLLTSKYALTSNAVKPPYGENIYEWAAGRLTLVSVFPNGESTNGQIGDSMMSFRHALSNDGSKVFWTADEGHRLYMTNTLTGRSLPVDTPGPGGTRGETRFQLASADGSKVFFLNSGPLTGDSDLPKESEEKHFDLYVDDTATGALTDLTGDEHLAGGEPADVRRMVLGASEDGSIVYFVARGVLADGARSEQDNLYVMSEAGSVWSAPRLVSVLSPEDDVTWGERGLGSEEEPRLMTSRVSPNGRYLAFMSDRSLTGYDNRDANSGQPDEEVFLYDESSGHLHCVSCNPTGARPVGVLDKPQYSEPALLADPTGLWQERWLAAVIPAWEHANADQNVGGSPYQSRYLSDEGRLFFNSFDSLAAPDTNGKADVYEYDPQEVGSCETPGGCTSLISSGTSSAESAFMDASGMGPDGKESEDVFFLTAARLAPEDYDSAFDIYDAHVCSQAVPCATQPVASPPCSSGDSCKAAPTPQPSIFGAPASATFSGAGNVAPTVSSVVKGKKQRGGKPAKKPRKKPAKSHRHKRSRGRKARRSPVHKSLSSHIGR